MEPKITVGIPAFNAEKYIAVAIKSVLSQSYKDFELIIVDDGSTDNTVMIAKSFKDPRITVLSDGERRGISYRLNQQVDLAKGLFFARMDADDIMLPDRLERQLMYLTQHPDVDMIGGTAIVIDENDKILGIRGNFDKEKIFNFEEWRKGTCYIHPTVMGKTETFRKLRYLEEFNGIEDYNLWFRASLAAKLIILPDTFLLYRDPLKFKLKTYLFRERQIRKFLRSKEFKGQLSKSEALGKIMRANLASFLAILTHFTYLEKFYISRRNSKFYDDKDEIYRYIASLK